ncbi:tail fiber assembly protein, partial [Escherichia coli]|uniref:tail fiber assembly protein n=1 Tax=Escherichia coli TaxID=562 RepID=UPI001FCEA134
TDGDGSHGSTSKTPSYTKSVSWHHYPELGPLPENVTWLSPEGEFQKWNGTAWVKDTEAEKLFRIREAEETKNNLMQVASEHIAPLQDAADLEIATEEEISLLEAWKKYRVLLNRVDTSTAQDIEWPALP